MEGRSTVYNKITSEEKIAQINIKNKELCSDFIEYLKSIDRSPSTIYAYEQDLNVFMVWNLENNSNKEFIKITKRELAKFQNHALNVWGWSPRRLRRIKSVISSLSNFITDILDEEEEYQDFKSIIKKIPSPLNEEVREKTVFEPEELEKLLDKLVEEKKYMQACMVSLAMNSGRRKSELPRFKVEYFDKSNIKFGSLYCTPEKVKTKGRGVKGKQLTLYVLKNGFEKYLNLWLEERKRLGITSEWLFPDKTNGEWSETNQIAIGKLDGWADYYSQILGKPFYWHSLRHYFTTMCVKSKLPQNVIQSIIGWTSGDMVNLYTDLSVEDTIGEYFNEDGIVVQEEKKLSDI